MPDTFDLSRERTNRVLQQGITFFNRLNKTYQWIAGEIARRTGTACSHHLVEKVRNQGALFGLPKALAFARLCAEHGHYDVLLFYAGAGFLLEPMPVAAISRSHLGAVDGICRALGAASASLWQHDFSAARREALCGCRLFRRLLREIDAIEIDGMAATPDALAA